jgi:formyltetrahydrofolate deformylase
MRMLQLPETFILKVSCNDVPGIVADISSFLFKSGCNIVESQQFSDRDTGRFFLRMSFTHDGYKVSQDILLAGFATIAAPYGMEWTIRNRNFHKRVTVLVSKLDHCLVDLLYRHRLGDLPMDISAIVSNHPAETYTHLDLGTASFHYLPITTETKPQQEEILFRLIEDTKTDLVVLARYMQVLSEGLVTKLAGRCINIHHSFLPGFKGAKPYHQAYMRGVKLIGATAHFVTTDLDEGPIIEQDVVRITHLDTVNDLIRKGRDIERQVLARAVSAYLDDRTFLSGRKTIVFTS